MSLQECKSLHSLPGRLRISCHALQYLECKSGEIQKRALSIRGVRSVAVNTITLNILVLFNENETNSEQILLSVHAILLGYSTLASRAQRLGERAWDPKERKLQEQDSFKIISRILLAFTGIIVSSLRSQQGVNRNTTFSRLATFSSMTAFGLAWPIIRNGFLSVVALGRPNADTLGSCAILANLLTRKERSALTIIMLGDAAELLTSYSMRRTRMAIREMLSTGERYVRLLTEDNKETSVPIEKVVVGDKVLVCVGEKISVDGIVKSGKALVDQSAITGEYLPAQKKARDKVFAGSVVTSGGIVIGAESVGDNTAVSRIIHMVEEASQHRADIQTFTDRISSAVIPIHFVLAGLVYGVTRDITRAVNMLVIDYSCGSRLSTATAFSAAISTAARNGVLIKGGSHIETLDKTDTFILDKTGTLTEGRPQVASIIPIGDQYTREEVLGMATAAEDHSSHPMGQAIVYMAHSLGVNVPQHSETSVYVSRGAETTVDGDVRILIGSRKYMRDNRIDLTAAADAVAMLARSMENIVYVARKNALIGVIGIQDTLKHNMKKALNRLRWEGVDDIILLTGDIEQHAEIISSRMALDSYKAEMLPEDKASTVLKLQSQGIVVAMVGDGINDAPALAYADVGIAIGSKRADIAMEAADITIASDNPLLIPATVRLAHKTMWIIRQNLLLTIGINSGALVLASLGSLPSIWSAIVHNLSTVILVGNSARLLFTDMGKGK